MDGGARRPEQASRGSNAALLIANALRRQAGAAQAAKKQARELACRGFFDSLGETAMAKGTKKSRPWTKEDVRLLKSLVREKTKTSVVARKLKRTEGATRQKASVLGVKLVGSLRRKRKP
jgi:hypothetical protein